MSNKILHENKYSCYKKELILYYKFKYLKLLDNMENFDDDQDFNSEEVQKIAKAAVEVVVKQDQNIAYQKDKVNQWCQQIIEACIKDLAKLQKPFKYAVTCIIM
jgi:glutamyl/glutaminyl-tRNA synthetase